MASIDPPTDSTASRRSSSSLTMQKIRKLQDVPVWPLWTVVEGIRPLATERIIMFKKFLLATALAGSVLTTGASASAADFAQDTPAPPPSRVTPIGDFSGSEPPGYSAYTIRCVGHVACDSLQAWCARDGGSFYDYAGIGGTKGMCIK